MSCSSDEDGLGAMFGNEEEDREREKLIESRNKRVDIQVPRYVPQPKAQTRKEIKEEQENDEQESASYIVSPAPLILKHKPGNHHSLWGHLLWNAGRHIVYLMDTKKIDVKGKSVLELGCGVAAPSFVAALNGARVVCATDYPDEDLLEVVAENAAKVLVLDETTRIVGTGGDCNSASSSPSSSSSTLDSQYTLEEIDKVILDERIRDIVKKKSGLEFKQAPDNDKQSAPAATLSPCTSQDEPAPESQPQQQQKQQQKTKRLPRLNFFVEGLCWGNGDNIQRVCEKSGCVGFDIIFLSDLMFNHICHDQLLATVSRLLSRDPAARAYVVFSFHRVHKKDDDLNFFKKCTFYGLKWQLVEVNNDYPLMFPDDPGDAAIRKPVNVYELRLNFGGGENNCNDNNNNNNNNNNINGNKKSSSSSTSSPLDKFKYDVVIQGTGLVETLVSASCARAGLSVLHLDASSQYGSGFFSSSNKDDKFIEFIRKHQAAAASSSSSSWSSSVQVRTPCIDRLEHEIQRLRPQEHETQDGTTTTAMISPSPALVDLEFSLADAKKIICSSRQLNLDAFTTPFLAESSLILAIAQSQMAEHIEFQNVHRVVCIGPGTLEQNGQPLRRHDHQRQHPVISRVPVTRADVFNSGTSCCSMLEARRLMRFVGDISNRSALERDTDVQRERHASEVVESLQAAHREVDLASTTIQELLTSKYAFSQKLVDLVTLGGTLLDPTATSSASAVSVIFNYLTSIGRYSGSTPYLAPMYSASDLPQIFSRMSAVWGACFALERCAVKVVKVEGSFLKNSGDAYSAGTANTSASPTPRDISLPPNGTRLVLDNGQHISAKCFICPRVFFPTAAAAAAAGTTASPHNNHEEFVRAIIVSKKALVTWKALEETCADVAVDDEAKSMRLNCSDPLCVGYCVLTNGAKRITASFLQWTDLLEQSPPHVVVCHITAKREDVQALLMLSSSSSLSSSSAAASCESSFNMNMITDSFLNLIRDQLFDSTTTDHVRDTNIINSNNNNNPEQGRYAVWHQHVVFATSFLWGEDEAFLSSIGTEENKKLLVDSLTAMNEERASKRKNCNSSQDEDDYEENPLHVIEAKTMFGDLNDSLYAEETERVFRLALRACGRNDDVKEMPIIKGKANEGEDGK